MSENCEKCLFCSTNTPNPKGSLLTIINGKEKQWILISKELEPEFLTETINTLSKIVFNYQRIMEALLETQWATGLLSDTFTITQVYHWNKPKYIQLNITSISLLHIKIHIEPWHK